jgi:hypothetical protein
MELSVLTSLSSSSEVAQKILNQDPTVLEALVMKLVSPQQNQTLQKYSTEIDQISRQTGLDIAELAYPLTSDPLTIRQDQTTFVQSSAAELPQYDFSAFQKALEQDKQRAQEMIQKLVQIARAAKQEFIKELEDKPIHPYERMIQDYLGKKFKPKPIQEMVIEPDIDPLKVIAKITELSRNLHEKAMLQVRKMTEQALDTSFPGITSEALGSAFAVLSGDEFVIDHEMTRRHLEFVENIRNIPVDYVIERPYEAAKRILSEFLRCEYAF